MSTLSRILRCGPPCLLGLALVAAPALAADKSAPRLPATQAGHRFVLSGSLTANGPAPMQGSGIELTSRLSTPGSDVALQEHGPYALMAKLAVSPMVCYNDTIFRDNFDGG